MHEVLAPVRLVAHRLLQLISIARSQLLVLPQKHLILLLQAFDFLFELPDIVLELLRLHVPFGFFDREIVT